MSETDNLCIYRIDPSDVITFLDGNWNRFAAENGAGELVGDQLIGKLLWDYAFDHNTQYLYKLVLEKVRSKLVSASFPYRCDSPDKRRFMTMEIVPAGNDFVEFRSCIVREEPRESVSVLVKSQSRSGQLIIMCSYCKRVKLAEWIEIEDAIRAMKLFDSVLVPSISHGVCDSCCKMVMDQIDQM